MGVRRGRRREDREDDKRGTQLGGCCEHPS